MTTRSQNFYDFILKKDKRTQTKLKFPLDVENSGHGNTIRFNINVHEGSKYLGKTGPNGVGVNKATGEDDVVPVFRRDYSENPSSATAANRFSGNSTRIDTVIDMYMPAEVQSSYQTNWNAQSMGWLAGMADVAMGLDEGSGEEVWDQVLHGAVNTMTKMFDAIFPFEIKGNVANFKRGVSNPYMEVLFEGIENRTFSFTFKMIPRNEDEQIEIQKIVNTFKFHQAPETKFDNNNVHWLFPSEFDIKFIHKGEENPWIFKISTCALTNLEVNHSPEGQYSPHADGSPFATVMTLQFTEMEVHTKENILQGF